MNQYFLYLHFQYFSLDFARFSIQKLQKFVSEDVIIDFKILNNTIIQIFFVDEPTIIKQVLEFFLYFSHPFYLITNEKNKEEKKRENLNCKDLFSNALSYKKYVLHSIQEQSIYLPLFLELQFQIHNNVPEDIKEIKFVNPYVEYNTLPIEQLLFYSYQFQNISMRSLISLFKLPLPKQKTLYSNIKASMHSIVQSQLQLKRLKEESTKAGSKMRMSILNFNYLDVKFHKNDFDVCTSSFIKIVNQKDFDELFSQYLYQAEFITKHLIGILTVFPIKKTLLNKYRLKLRIYKEIIYSNKNYFIYIITKKN